MTRPAAVGLLVAGLFSPASVRATEANFAPEVEGNRVTLALAASPSDYANIFTVAGRGQLQILPHLSLALEVPVAIGRVFGEPVNHASAGSIVVGANAFGAVLPFMVLWGVLSVGVPTTFSVPTTNDGLGTSSVVALASIARDGYDRELFLMESASLRARFGLEISFATRWRYRFEIASLFAFPVTPMMSQFDLLESTSEFQVQIWRDLAVGIRGQAVLLFPSFAGGAFVLYEPPGRGFNIRLDGLLGSATVLSLDEYIPFPVWSMALRVGYRF